VRARKLKFEQTPPFQIKILNQDFDKGGDNLSKRNCGIWTDRSKAAPWRIAVGRADGATCFGILLSNYDFITCKHLNSISQINFILSVLFPAQCIEVFNDFRKDATSVMAFNGSCYDEKLGIGDASAKCNDSNQIKVKYDYTFSSSRFKMSVGALSCTIFFRYLA
jgi:hypothetical protein